MTFLSFPCPSVRPGRHAPAHPKMNDIERIKKHHGGPTNTGDQFNRPYWKRAHKSPFFWIAFVFLLTGITIFIVTDGFLLRPRPAAVPQTDSAHP
jgi:hypothetical protein